MTRPRHCPLGRLVWTREEILEYLESRPRVELPQDGDAA